MKALKLSMAVVLIVGAAQVSGNTGSSFTKIKTLLSNDGAFGGCMVKLDAMPANGVCGNAGSAGYVSFMCDGSEGVTKSGALQRWDQAVLAWMLQKNVSVSMTADTLTSEGYCYVYDIRIDR